MQWTKLGIVKTVFRFIFTILVVAAFTLVLWVFRAYLSIQVIALLFMMPVLLSTRLWGLVPGILSALLSFLSFNYFFTVPYFTLMVHQTQDFLALIVFLIISVVVSQLLGQDQESLAAATAREREATRLYELSIALAGLMNDQDILQILAEKICETFYAEKVAVDLHDGLEANTFGCPAEQASPAPDAKTRRPDQVFPLATVRGPLGSVSLWRSAGKLSRAEERLLNTFTSQGALAIERARLIKTENRATVLEDSDRLKTSLLNSVSHELRSPLATIKASISSLRSGMVDWDSEGGKELMTGIEEETDHLNQLVGNLLDMSRIETGALNPQRKWNSLSEIVGGVLKRMHQDVQKHHIVVDMSDIPPVPVDYIQMEQVFSNLISNSVKYAPPETEVFITARLQNDQTLLVQVSNEGPHVTEGDLPRIFDKFYRVTAAEKITGTGLGLSVCKGIIEAHGGKIWAENAPGRFIFNFTLPVTWEGMYPQIPEEA
jgi:two-component system, OmpR family, sensor histidine kinase KdpD